MKKDKKYEDSLREFQDMKGKNIRIRGITEGE